jgi:putative ABC transport system permease protein
MFTGGGDPRYALRSMRRNPGFAAFAVISLALGIGSNTAIFSLIDQLLLWSVPARDPARLVTVSGGRSMTYPFYREYRDRNQVFSSLLASSDPIPSGLRPNDASAAETVHVTYVSGNYFLTLGVGAAAGRVIVPSDDGKPGGSPVAVISYNYWQRRFAGSTRAIGQELAVNGYPFEIAGVAEPGFTGIYNGRPADVIVPITMYPLTTPAALRWWDTPNMYWLSEVGRLKPGVSMEQAQAAMRVLWPQAMEAVNDAAAKDAGRRREYHEDPIALSSAAHGASFGPNQWMNPLEILAFTTGFVLLIACANVANLLLARASGRGREIAIRLAVGASRIRLVRQLMIESGALAAAGGCAGIAVAEWGIWALAKTNIVTGVRLEPNLRLLGYSAGVTIITALLFGLAPALRATRVGVADAMKEGGSSGQGGSRLRLGKTLVGVEVALSLALLIGAGMFIRTLRNLDHVDLGFRRENVLIADVNPTTYGYRGRRLTTFYDQLLDRARTIPGVRSAALAAMTPMGAWAQTTTLSAEGYQPKPGERLVAYSNHVSSQYFTTLGIPMLLGRDFRPREASPVCIVNAALARDLFGDGNPIGRHLHWDETYSAQGAMEIVGVVKDVHHGAVRSADNLGIVYVPAWSGGAGARLLILRAAGDDVDVVAALRRDVHGLNPNIPVLSTTTLAGAVDASLRSQRMIAYLAGFFGALALGLASVGLYGVMAHLVARRTREVGIRMALGAEPRDVVRMIAGESLVPVIAGLFAGIAVALAAAHAVRSLLFGVAPRDPVSIVLAAVAMLVVALAAAAIPARRASRVDPMIALRDE